ncbi:MAG TPA: leucyl/phenylalanyl-tRNA--protein transferase, partial [Usitatibacter sp.]|nr:leucyl/phenylalanyl-tRNA--protein transferase [Usitatibacter sp.]
MIPWLRGDEPFPPVSKALRSPNGLLCAGGDLSPARLVEAYRHGIFPWFSEGDPILWWSPDPRMVLFPEELRVSRSLRKTLARGVYETRVDTAFRPVIEACAAPRDAHGGTWIVPGMVDAYTRLHALGIAHSVESWSGDVLVGGLYGLALGKVFFGESMFSRATDASKVALVRLAQRLRERQFRVIDCQQATAHLASLGAREIP